MVSVAIILLNYFIFFILWFKNEAKPVADRRSDEKAELHVLVIKIKGFNE
tara:strand:+ start:7063 stop:7212 length:150 start_codon:yes stop_codon:yes gene_type:complete